MDARQESAVDPSVPGIRTLHTLFIIVLRPENDDPRILFLRTEGPDRAGEVRLRWDVPSSLSAWEAARVIRGSATLHLS